MVVETIEHKGYKITVHNDEDAINPREDFDNFGRMICFHKRYDLGDKHTEDHELDPMEFKAWIEKHTGKDVVSLPLYLFDHGGITMSTSDSQFRACDSHGWDWGLVGWIYVTKENIRKEYSKKRCSKSTVAKALELLRGEVKTYDDYITGRVYGYNIYKADDEDNEESLDSCWGFFGEYNDYMVPEAKSIIDHWIEEGEKAE